CRRNAHGLVEYSLFHGKPRGPPARQLAHRRPPVRVPLPPAPADRRDRRLRFPGPRVPGWVRDRGRALVVLHPLRMADLTLHRPVGDPQPGARHAGVESLAPSNGPGAHAPGRRTDAADLGEPGFLAERVRLRSHGIILGTRRDAGAPPATEPGRDPRGPRP